MFFSDIHWDQESTVHVYVFVHPVALFPLDQLFLDVRRRWVKSRIKFYSQVNNKWQLFNSDLFARCKLFWNCMEVTLGGGNKSLGELCGVVKFARWFYTLLEASETWDLCIKEIVTSFHKVHERLIFSLVKGLYIVNYLLFY